MPEGPAAGLCGRLSSRGPSATNGLARPQKEKRWMSLASAWFETRSGMIMIHHVSAKDAKGPHPDFHGDWVYWLVANAHIVSFGARAAVIDGKGAVSPQRSRHLKYAQR